MNSIKTYMSPRVNTLNPTVLDFMSFEPRKHSKSIKMPQNYKQGQKKKMIGNHTSHGKVPQRKPSVGSFSNLDTSYENQTTSQLDADYSDQNKTVLYAQCGPSSEEVKQLYLNQKHAEDIVTTLLKNLRSRSVFNKKEH